MARSPSGRRWLVSAAEKDRHSLAIPDDGGVQCFRLRPTQDGAVAGALNEEAALLMMLRSDYW